MQHRIASCSTLGVGRWMFDVLLPFGYAELDWAGQPTYPQTPPGRGAAAKHPTSNIELPMQHCIASCSTLGVGRWMFDILLPFGYAALDWAGQPTYPQTPP